ncbi:unnamed protein product [Rotaria sp. Silwood2]|nr:unnamed protein product [Rotaria sp. Silwood2]CAF4271564.1 unnamed protein product [Rotaria sp. Silwood2]
MAESIERVAIDKSGTLRSFYDGCRDIIRGKLIGNFMTNSTLCKEQPICLLINGRTAECQNLLEMMKFDCELRLSIYLKLVPVNGIASLIDYPRRIDQHTRFIYFQYKTHTESCSDSFDMSQIPSFSKTFATHIITEINWGMNIIIVLQLAPDQAIKVDSILNQICMSLINDKRAMEMDQKEEDLCNNIISTTVYSNIDEFTKLNKLTDVYREIFKFKKVRHEHQRLNYILYPTKTLYPERTADNIKFLSIDLTVLESLEVYLLQLFNELKQLHIRLHCELPDLLKDKLEKELKIAHKSLQDIHEIHEQQLQQIRELVIEIRKGINIEISIDKLNQLYSQTTFNESIHKLTRKLEKLESKSKLIEDLSKNRFEYCNVANLGIEDRLEESQIQDILIGNDSSKAVFLSNDRLRDHDHSGWNEIYSEMIEENRKNRQLRLIYADFTYSTYNLKKMTIALSKDMTINQTISNSQLSENDVKGKTYCPTISSSSTKKYINILLFGESGVGKSTFINAFANYLYFQTLDQAQQEKPIVIIPVSFTMTINDIFDEKIIKFGDIDSNENHNNLGQSVTQKCQCYVFDISQDKKLCIIDTPGFGDTRGDNQDNLNMEEIFSFLHNIPYLNGICLLFKPEILELHPYFYSCFTQLFDYFGENIRDYIIFCFTNARSTFFAPGNTRTLLKTFFDSFPIKNIPFEKNNTFCFDSEAFRYLVALQNSIEFDPNERNELEQSWLRSVIESKRFRNFLCNQHSYRKNIQWQSIKHARFQIKNMIRPILETLRNHLRNIILYNSNSCIKLQATHTKQSTMICYAYNRHPKNYGDIWIMPDHLHYSPDMCTSGEQKPIKYTLNYEFLNQTLDESIKELKSEHDNLYVTCAKFSYFLMKTSSNSKENPFLSDINRIIHEEKYICRTQTMNDLNRQLLNRLEELKIKYEEYLHTIKSSSDDLTLSGIYNLIKSTYKISMIKIQLNAINKYQQTLVLNNQHEVFIDKTCS